MNREDMLKRLEKGEDPLELSIEKWEDIVQGKGKDLQGSNCALCEKHLRCDKCPVVVIARKTQCMGTPYRSYFYHPTKENAQAELDFLKSLREEV